MDHQAKPLQNSRLLSRPGKQFPVPTEEPRKKDSRNFTG
jgi:hypothetical protein